MLWYLDEPTQKIGLEEMTKKKLGGVAWVGPMIQPDKSHYGSMELSRWWFHIFLIFIPKIGEDEPILTHIFQMDSFNHQLDNGCWDVLLVLSKWIVTPM